MRVWSRLLLQIFGAFYVCYLWFQDTYIETKVALNWSEFAVSLLFIFDLWLTCKFYVHGIRYCFTQRGLADILVCLPTIIEIFVLPKRGFSTSPAAMVVSYIRTGRIYKLLQYQTRFSKWMVEYGLAQDECVVETIYALIVSLVVSSSACVNICGKSML